MPKYQINDTGVMYYIERLWLDPYIWEVVYSTKYYYRAVEMLAQLQGD